MRKLATIQTISSLSPIEGADRIELAKFKMIGWQVVVQKGYGIGDKIIFCEIDSQFQEKPEFEFLRAKQFRIKSCRLKKTLSQGICFPLSILPLGEYKEGDDVTETLGITLYEKPVPVSLAGKIKGNFPSWIAKTDEYRIQSYPHLIERYGDMEFLARAKLDGSSCTFYAKDGDFGVCSRNLDLLEEEGNIFWKMANKYGLQEKMLKYCEETGVKDIVLQGECVGPSIQDNRLKLKEVEFRLFSWREASRYLPNIEEIAEKFELKTCPALFTFKPKVGIDELIKMAERKSALNPDVWEEGIVCRPTDIENHNIYDPDIGRLSFKIINNQYLLKHEI